uniref:Disease resistance protein winged helix domain-containing protein n=1 Tax=Physcomitrium patens TaxID=3218 RepID=A0A2K1KTL7_PHYPA|nr:hypothetical protein PHYPA_004093 [Physcomitrium patens]
MAEALALTVLQPVLEKHLLVMLEEVALPEWNDHKHEKELEICRWRFVSAESLPRLRNEDHWSLREQLEVVLLASVSRDLSCPPGAGKAWKYRSKIAGLLCVLAAFPEDWEVDVNEDLLPLWRAEGIVGQLYAPKLEACGLVGVLVSRSLIELKSYENGELYCMVHDILRDLERHIVQHEKAVTERECLYEAGRDMRDGLPREWRRCSDTKDPGRGRRTRLSARRLSVMSTNLKELPAKLDAPELEVLLLQENLLECIPKKFFNNLRNIRVLDQRGTCMKVLPESVGDLKSPSLLNLSWTGKRHS